MLFNYTDYEKEIALLEKQNLKQVFESMKYFNNIFNNASNSPKGAEEAETVSKELYKYYAKAKAIYNYLESISDNEHANMIEDIVNAYDESIKSDAFTINAIEFFTKTNDLLFITTKEIDKFSLAAGCILCRE